MPWSRFSVPLSKWMRCQSLLKQTWWQNLSTHLSSPAAAMFVENEFNPSALWWRGWLRYCWSSVHHRIKPALTIWLVWTALVRASFLPNGAIPDRTSRPQMLWARLSSSGIQASLVIQFKKKLCNRSLRGGDNRRQQGGAMASSGGNN